MLLYRYVTTCFLLEECYTYSKFVSDLYNKSFVMSFFSMTMTFSEGNNMHINFSNDVCYNKILTLQPNYLSFRSITSHFIKYLLRLLAMKLIPAIYER